jgi:WD40 repeat protein
MKAESNIHGHISPVRSMVFDTTDGQMLTADESGEIKLWTISDLEQPPVSFTDTEKDILRLAFSAGGDAFLCATNRDITQRPAHIRCMTSGVCDKVTRNLSEQEWTAWVGGDIEYEPTCPDKEYQIRVREIKGAK